MTMAASFSLFALLNGGNLNAASTGDAKTAAGSDNVQSGPQTGPPLTPEQMENAKPMPLPGFRGPRPPLPGEQPPAGPQDKAPPRRETPPRT
jgi:hypothetical protein